MVLFQKWTCIQQHDDTETNIEREDDSKLNDMEGKRKALLRSILSLLAAGILTITIGALLTDFESTYGDSVTYRVLKDFLPTPSNRFHKSRPHGTSEGGPRDFMRDPSEYILSPPPWSRIRVRPKVKEYDWNITDVVANPDGVFRPMVLINGQFPGPLIECNEHDIIKVTIHNQATNATAFHWHGIFHNGTNWMDGTTGVTQCPIPPGESFTYEFNTTGQYGTYWYHSHFGTQYTDGLFGPLVIHSPSEPGTDRYKTDQVIMLHDHYHDLSRNKLYQYLAPDNENDEPIPDGALVNGRNSGNCSSIDYGHKCNSTGTELAEIHISPNHSHRLRFINVGAFAEFEVSVDQHPLEVIEADGTPLAPSSYHRLHVNVAQRYSVIVNANATDTSAFWMRARMLTHCFSDPDEPAEPEVRAVVRYGKTIKTEAATRRSLSLPTTKPWNDNIALICKDMDGKLEPAISIPAPNPDKLIYLRSNFEIGNYSLSRGFFNQSNWKADLRNPTLNRLISAGMNDPAAANSESMMHEIFDAKKGMVLEIDGIKVVDLLIDNFDDGNHPMHLHGHKFWVMAQGNGYFNMSDYAALPTHGRLIRDTVTIEAYGYLLIRFVTDNPGMWAFHCHNVWHAEAGLMMSFLTRSDIVKNWTLPSNLLGFCSHKDATKGMFNDMEEVVPPEWKNDQPTGT